MMIDRLFPTIRPSVWIQACLLSACLPLAQAQTPSEEVRIDAYGAAFNAPQLAPKAQTRVYAYRTEAARQSAPINLYLNGRYHTSLLQGGYTEFCLNPGHLAVQAALDDAGRLHAGKTQAGHPLDAQSGRVIYLRVTEDTEQAIQVLTESQALPEIRRTRLQTHTLSRAPAVQPCGTDLASPAPMATPVKPMAKAAPKRDFVLAADALFEFGKAELKPAGIQSIQTLVQQVKQEYSSVERIRVLGYTDAIGPAHLNSKLSAARAHSVAELLDRNDLRPSRGYTTEGRGSAELAKLSCKNKPTPENKACHAPNRRVVISVIGTRK